MLETRNGSRTAGDVGDSPTQHQGHASPKRSLQKQDAPASKKQRRNDGNAKNIKQEDTNPDDDNRKMNRYHTRNHQRMISRVRKLYPESEESTREMTRRLRI
jgi:hypothetical protein